MLAAMARLRYPHLFHASVSSSSPLLAQLDMVGYNDVVASSTAAEDVGGSQQCLDVVVQGHAAIGKLLETADGRKSLEQQFNVCVPGSLSKKENREQFAGDGVVYIPAQSNDPADTSPLGNIASICQFLLSPENGAEPIDRLAALSSAQHGGTCVSASYDAMIKGMSNPSNPGMRVHDIMVYF